MRRGFTLLELVLGLTLMALTLGIALPRMAAIRDSWIAEEAAQGIIQAHRRARLSAIVTSRIVVLTVAPDSLTITTSAGTVLWRRPGPAAGGATLAGPLRRLTFSPVGITMGFSNATFRISRGAALRSVIVSRLGRIRLVRGS
jgi:prepilin-type N-terminal cleavage/methylation domain-containing protein